LTAVGLQVVIECLTRQVRQFEFDGVPGLLLSNRRPIDSVAPGSDVFDPDADHVTATEFAVDSQIEERQIPFAAFRPKGRLRIRSSQLSLVPGEAL